MNARHCCQFQTPAGDTARRPASRLRRGGELAGWVVPSVTLALIPKCPVCVAAYVALATGIGISLPIASWLRTMLVALCAASLVYFTLKRLKRSRRLKVSVHARRFLHPLPQGQAGRCRFTRFGATGHGLDRAR